MRLRKKYYQNYEIKEKVLKSITNKLMRLFLINLMSI